jgi:hypothetical protein
LLTFHWLLAGAALVVAAAALLKARRVSKRLERLTESHWDLRYEHGQLRSRLSKLDPDQAPGAALGRLTGTTTFVPLSWRKR